MELITRTIRELVVESGDELNEIHCSADTEIVNHLLVFKKKLKRVNCTMCTISGECKVERVIAGDNGRVTINGSGGFGIPSISTLSVLKNGRVTIYGPKVDFDIITIQKDGALHGTKEFFESTKKMTLCFEEDSYLVIDGKVVPYRGYNDPHDFINCCLHPRLVYVKDASIVVKPTEDETVKDEKASDKCKTCKQWTKLKTGTWVCGLALSLSHPRACDENNNFYEPKDKEN